MNIKKIGLYVGFVVVVMGIAYGLYAVFFRPTGNVPVTNTNTPGQLPGVTPGQIPVVTPTTTPPAGFPTAVTVDAVASGGLTQVTDYGPDGIVNPKITGGGLVYYQPGSSQFVSLNVDGKTVPYSDPVFYGVETVTWSPVRQQAILEYPDGSNIMYDFNTKKQITLPKELEKFSIDPSGTTLAAVWQGGDQDNQWLTTSKLDGSDLKLVEPISGNNVVDLQVSISPDNQIIALYREAIGTDKQQVIPIGRNGENFKSFTVDGLKFQGNWSPAGDNLLYNASNAGDSFKPRLWLTQGSAADLGYSHTDLQLQTWANKCTFNRGGDQIFCAVPRELPDGAGLYPSLADTIPDVFYRIDLASGVRVPLAIPVGNEQLYNAASVFLSADESMLYFTDRFSNKLHSIQLK
ncbi:MAG: hypothetical protein V1846_01565 [Candidatus Komeilibacteria bacterium]